MPDAIIDIYYGNERAAKMCARFIHSFFLCPDISPTTATRPDLARFIAYILYRTRVEFSVTIHALCLLARLKKEYPRTCYPSGHGLFITSFIISTKMTLDESFECRAWPTVCQGLFTLLELGQMEREMCRRIDWWFRVKDECLQEFEEAVCLEFASPLLPPRHLPQTVTDMDELDPSNPHITQQLNLLRNVQANGDTLPAAPGPQDMHPAAYAGNRAMNPMHTPVGPPLPTCGPAIGLAPRPSCPDSRGPPDAMGSSFHKLPTLSPGACGGSPHLFHPPPPQQLVEGGCGSITRPPQMALHMDTDWALPSSSSLFRLKSQGPSANPNQFPPLPALATGSGYPKNIHRTHSPSPCLTLYGDHESSVVPPEHEMSAPAPHVPASSPMTPLRQEVDEDYDEGVADALVDLSGLKRSHTPSVRLGPQLFLVGGKLGFDPPDLRDKPEQPSISSPLMPPGYGSPPRLVCIGGAWILLPGTSPHTAAHLPSPSSRDGDPSSQPRNQAPSSLKRGMEDDGSGPLKKRTCIDVPKYRPLTTPPSLSPTDGGLSPRLGLGRSQFNSDDLADC